MLSYFPTTIGVALKGGCRFFVPNVVGVILGYRKQYEPGFPDTSWGNPIRYNKLDIPAKRWGASVGKSKKR